MTATTHYSTYEEHAYLYQLFEITQESIATYIYYKQIKKLREEMDSLWHIHTQNAYQTVIIKNWNKLFGADSEPTHYKKLLTIGNLCKYSGLEDKEALKKQLLTLTNIKPEEFKKYWEEMNSYRNEYSIHTQHHPSNQLRGLHPNLAPAFEMFKALHTILFSIMNNLPNFPNDNSNISFNPLCQNVSTLQLIQKYEEDLTHSPLAKN